MSGGRGIAVGGGLGTLVIMILALLFGFDPQTLLQQSPDNQPTQVQTSRPQNSEEEELKQFVAVVLAKSEDVWQDVFRRRLDRSTVLVTRRSTSILPSTKNCAGNLVRLEILRRRTSSRMK
jgi:predicted metalloprotease